MRLECHKEPYDAALWTHKQGMQQPYSLVTDRQTHRTTTVTLQRMRRGLMNNEV